ncbi:SH3 domain-containing protein [Geobacter sp.]|uniref:SH3 domain-containing protein n=1 Tax=Geobacter sp. TaxID=46610 RepID=UPI0026165027|nr:SH3 domain-containing protein [Geobacter sp.]
MTQHHQRTRFARMALLIPLSLMTACATVNTPPVAEHAGPLAPGTGFEVDAPTTSPSPAAVPPPAPVPSPAAPPAPPASLKPVAGRIRHHHKYVNVRPDPSSRNRPVAVLRGGKRIKILGEEGNWVKIRWSRGKRELEGWVFRKYVEGRE